MYVKITNGTPEIYTIGQLRKDNPSVSFPKVISNEVLATYNVYPLTYTDVPEYNPATHKVVEGITGSGSTWSVSWTITELTQAEKDEYQAQLEADAKAWRDGELKSTDLLVSTIDYPYRGSLSVYRKALRDWTSTEDFPETRPTHTESKTTVTRLEFISRLTIAEEAAIRGSSDTTVQVVLGRLEVAEFVDLTDPQTSGMLDILVSKSLLTAERKTEILA